MAGFPAFFASPHPGRDRHPDDPPCRQPAARPLDHPVRPAPVRRDPARALRAGVRRGARRAPRRHRRHRRRHRAADVRQHRRRTRPQRSRPRPDPARCSSTWRRPRPRRRCRRSNARWRRGSPPTRAPSTSTPGSSPGSTPCYRQRAELAPDAESLRLLERIHLDFVRAGAALPAAARHAMAAIVERLATLSTRFSQNVLADEAAYQLVLRRRARSRRAAGGRRRRRRRRSRGSAAWPTRWVITLSRSLIVPFLTFSDRRDLREQAFQAWTRRGENDGDARQPPADRARSSRCGTSSRACTATRTTPTTRSSTGWPARRRRSPSCSTPCGSRRRRRRRPSATRCADVRAVLRRDAPDRAVGLALLRGEGARDATRLRRRRAQALLLARRGCSQAAFDTAQRLFGIDFVQRAGPAGLSPRRARLRGARPRRRGRSASSCPTTSRARPSAAARG